MKALSNSAAGAEQLSSPQLIPDSRPDADQGVKNVGEPSGASQIPSAGAAMSRRSMMNKIVSFAAAAAVPVPSPAMPTAPDIRAMHAYAAWLQMERRILCNEIWPQLGSMAEKIVFFDNAGAHWHLRNPDWRSDPQPSSRAAAVLDLVGVDWRNDEHDCGRHHPRKAQCPPLPAGWPSVDAELIELSAKLEPLVREYYARHGEWARRQVQAHKETDERFGEGVPFDVWDTENKRTQTEKGKFFEEALSRIRVGEALESLAELEQEIMPLATAIDKLPVTSLAGLKAKALVAFWRIEPLQASSGEFYFQDEAAFQQLFIAVAEFCGLSGSIAVTGYAMPEWPVLEEDEIGQA
ncbi:hypothetical protein [Bradyrhizobium sp. USDA 4454]